MRRELVKIANVYLSSSQPFLPSSIIVGTIFGLTEWKLTSNEAYPDLEGDEARRGIWIVDVPLAATHHLRNSINSGKVVPREILDRYEIPIVASVLKLYLLELPGKGHHWLTSLGTVD